MVPLLSVRRALPRRCKEACVTTTQKRIPDPEIQPVMDLWPDAGEILGICRRSAYKAAGTGEIPTIRIGRRLIVPVARLRGMLGMDGGDDAAA